MAVANSPPRHLAAITAPSSLGELLDRELAYHSELSANLYQSAIWFASNDRDGKAAECLEQAIENEEKANQIREMKSRPCARKLVGLRGGRQWGKDSDDVETLHLTVFPSGDFTIHRPVMRVSKSQQAPNHPAEADPLGLSPLTNCTATENSSKVVSIERARRGGKGVTSFNRRQVRSGAALLEKTFGRKQLSFLTATLPCRSIRHLALVADQADRVLDIAVKRLHRLLKSKGLPTDYVAVWELQERGALHLHLLCLGRHPWSSWAIHTHDWDSIWEDAVSAVLGEEGAGLSFRSSCRIERPRLSVARELSKYLSKGSKSQIDSLQETLKQQCSSASIQPIDLLPRSWVSMSKTLKNAIEEGTVRLAVEVEKSKLDWYELENLTRKTGKCVSKPKEAGGGALTRIHKTEHGFPVCLSGRLVVADIYVLLDALSQLGISQGGGLSKIA
ncbi:MAG: hypothetical protein HC926_03075 [Synechococcaceae cyanobacterium SM2_3_60]|nr:hypothetical protein [Synechococcaceae cyanobacterium SM2_3_60]